MALEFGRVWEEDLSSIPASVYASIQGLVKGIMYERDQTQIRQYLPFFMSLIMLTKFTLEISTDSR